MGVRGRVVAVIGAGSSIGRACSRRLRNDGAEVLAVDDEPWHPDGEELRQPPEHMIADLRSDAGARAVEERCRARWERLDVLLYVASAIDATHGMSATDLPSRADWDRVYETNVWGPMVYGRTLLPLLAVGGGSIIYLTSIDGLMGNPSLPAFSSSKGALTILTHVMADDAARHGVRVNAVATAAISQFKSTDPGGNVNSSALARVIASTPLRRAPTPENVAGVVSFFASDDSQYVTGAVLPVDGGRTAVTPGTLRPEQ